jgi:hypothetical protein
MSPPNISLTWCRFRNLALYIIRKEDCDENNFFLAADYEVTVSLNVHAMNMKRSYEAAW